MSSRSNKTGGQGAQLRVDWNAGSTKNDVAASKEQTSQFDKRYTRDDGIEKRK